MRVQIDRPHKRYQATPLFLDLDVLPRAGDAVFIDGDDVDWEVSSVTWLLDDGDPLVRVSLLEPGTRTARSDRRSSTTRLPRHLGPRLPQAALPPLTSPLVLPRGAWPQPRPRRRTG